MKKLSIFIGLFFLTISVLVIFSPFKKQKDHTTQMIKVTTVIDASPCEVFHYLGNSDNAAKWSSFVDHISLLEGRDGEVGSLRRCFKDAAEQAEQWDETTAITEPCKRRRLTIFNLKNFPVEADGLLTEQLYKATATGQCELSFTLFFEKENPGIWNRFKMNIFSYQIHHIFKKNLANIKKEVTDISITQK